MEPIRARTTGRLVALARAGLIATLIVGLVAAPVSAARNNGNGGKPSTGGSGGTISLSLMDGATEAHFGARVTFAISTTATAYPFVHLKCYKGGVVVGEGRQGFFVGALGNPWFYLGPTPSWPSGAADCTATLEKSTSKGWSILATTPSFHVYE